MSFMITRRNENALQNMGRLRSLLQLARRMTFVLVMLALHMTTTAFVMDATFSLQSPLPSPSSSSSFSTAAAAATTTKTTIHRQHPQSHTHCAATADSEAESTRSKNNTTCHFNKQPDHDCYVFDYEAAAKHYGESCSSESFAQESQLAQQFWKQFEAQNQARKKFGLPALSKEEYVVLQEETKAMGEQLSQDAIQTAFAQFDTNGDGVVSMLELEQGIREILRQELVTEDHVEAVMSHLDNSGDGVLHLDEFVSLNELRNRLEEVIREEEKQLSVEARELRQQQHQHQQQQQPGLLKSFLAAFQLPDEHSCETNFDCVQPEVCCDFHFKKFCCSSGEKARQLELQYAMVPVPQGIED